jgi:putative ABC transport system permease protein
LAQANGLTIGNQLEFETEDGTSVSGEIIGIFFSGMERKQEDSILSVYRIENQVFVDHSFFEMLFGTPGFSSVSVYTSVPEQMDVLYSDIEQLVGEEINLVESDTLYAQIQAPLQQVIRVTIVMLVLTLITAVIVVSLLLCMWMRTRQKEFAILISLGKSKWDLLSQVITESVTLFLLSVLGAACCTNLLSGKIMQSLFSAEEFSSIMNAHVQGRHLLTLIVVGGFIVLLAVGISIFPTLRTNPRDTLSRMEG